MNAAQQKLNSIPKVEARIFTRRSDRGLKTVKTVVKSTASQQNKSNQSRLKMGSKNAKQFGTDAGFLELKQKMTREKFKPVKKEKKKSKFKARLKSHWQKFLELFDVFKFLFEKRY